MNCQEASEHLDAYALGATDDDDTQLVAAHLAVCPRCRAALEACRAVVNQLGLAIATVRPSPGLKGRLLQAAQGSAAPRPATRAAPLPAPRRFQVAWALAGAALVLAIVALAWSSDLSARLERAQSTVVTLQEQLRQHEELVALMSGASVVEYSLAGTTVAPVAGARIYLDPARVEAAFLAWNLPALAPNRAYQLWLIDPSGKRTDGGVFAVTGEGSAQIIVRSPLPFNAYRSFGVTVEPAGGSPGPTGPRVLAGSI